MKSKTTTPQVLETYIKPKLIELAKGFDSNIVDGEEFAKKFRQTLNIENEITARHVVRYFSKRGYLSIRNGMVDISELQKLELSVKRSKKGKGRKKETKN